MGTTLRRAIAPTIPHMLFLPFLRTLPACDGQLFAARQSQFTGRSIFGNGRAGANGCSLAHADGSDELCIRANECVVLNDGAEFVRTVVVAGDGSGTDIDPAAHGAVANVAQMVRLAALADLAVLDFNEIPDMCIVMQFAAGT